MTDRQVSRQTEAADRKTSSDHEFAIFSREGWNSMTERADTGSILVSGLITRSRDQLGKLTFQFQFPTELPLMESHSRVSQGACWCHKKKNSDLGWKWFTFQLSPRTGFNAPTPAWPWTWSWRTTGAYILESETMRDLRTHRVHL